MRYLYTYSCPERGHCLAQVFSDTAPRSSDFAYAELLYMTLTVTEESCAA